MRFFHHRRLGASRDGCPGCATSTRVLTAVILLASLTPGAAHAEDKCAPLAMVDTIQMARSPDRNGDLVPVTLNGAVKNFLLDTGGLVSQIQKSAADDLKLPIRRGDIRLIDVMGSKPDAQVSIRQFGLGGMRAKDVFFPISTVVEPPGTLDGFLALDLTFHRDFDVDFGSDVLNFFSQDHCPGAGAYWTTPAVAVVPFTLKNNHIFVQVTLDGHAFQAIIDTGSASTFMGSGAAERIFGLTLGDANTPESGSMVFQTAAGSVAVNNPFVIIAQDKIRDADLLIGMDVLRELHIYFAFAENKMYISLTPGPYTIEAAPAEP
jgi:predicted aspartyl protease